MSKTDKDKEQEFNPWKWDRDMAATGRARLTVERHGHKVTLDHRGVSIDGQRIVRDDPSKGDHHGFAVSPQGAVVYRDTEVAAITAPEDGARRGEVTVWGKGGPSPSDRQEHEEAERHQRDERFQADQQHLSELTRDELERTR